MAVEHKRKRQTAATPADQGSSSSSSKKLKTGFKVGPDNLPDGTYLRKVKKIKSNLIQKAKIKKDFAKVKARLEQEAEEDGNGVRPRSLYQDEEEQKEAEPASLELHPDRQAMLESSATGDQAPHKSASSRDYGQRWQRRPKPMPFMRETQVAQRRNEAIENKKRQRQEADAQRQQKMQERARMQALMAKARKPGPNGQRRLGRESVVLLEKVKKLVQNG